MATPYGVTPTGLIIPSGAQVLRDIENKNIETFGPGILQTPQTKFGQMNGVIADMIHEVWEAVLDVYATHDIDQAVGPRLDSLAKLRLIQRLVGEDDIALRKAVTNAEQGRVDLLDVERAVNAVTGVSWCRMWVNEKTETDENGMPPGSVCIAALGGDDSAVALAARGYLAPGGAQYGNTLAEIEIDDRCRTMMIMRPTQVNATISLEVATYKGPDNCPAPVGSAIETGLLTALTTPRLDNGVDLTIHMVRTAAAQLYGRTVEVLSATGLPVSVDFDQIVRLLAVDVTVV